jgi:dihydrolipoamide dehydrogenase
VIVGEIPESVDLLVVGAGPGGYVAAVRAAELGRQVTVVDRDGLEGGTGGTCLHVGCIPSKALIELAEAFERTRTMATAGLLVERSHVDLASFQLHKRAIISGLARSVDRLLESHRVQRLSGEVHLIAPDRAAVAMVDGGTRFLEFSQAIIATGSRPARLPALPDDGERILTSTAALALDTLPQSAAIIGAGYIGLEIGIALARLGTSVAVVETLDRILPWADESLTRPVLRRMRQLGVRVYLSSEARTVDGDELIIQSPTGELREQAEKVIVTVGRTPNTDGIGLENTGVDVDERGLISVNGQRLASTRIGAVGDITHGPPVAHKASAEAIVVAEGLSGRRSAFEPIAIPVAVFTDPEIATVGLTEIQARAAGLDVAVSAVPFSSNSRAAILGAKDGFTRVVIDRTSDRVVGVHTVGPHASELIAEAALAVEMMASPKDIAGVIHPHPTLSESLYGAVQGLSRNDTMLVDEEGSAAA